MLAKLTAVTMGMVLSLCGMQQTLPPEGRLPERTRKQESCEWVPVMKEDQKIARSMGSSYDIMQEDAYGFNVSGQWTTGPGPDGIPWGIWFARSDAVLLVDVRPTVTEGRLFAEEWEDTQTELERTARENLGSELDGIRFFTRESGGEDLIYAMEYSCIREGQRWYVTACYRFGDSYIGEFIGVNPYSATDCREVTIGAAASFRELGRSAKREGTDGPDKDGWPFPFLHNPFAITTYYMDEEIPPAPSGERRAEDYEIKWKDEGIETILRALLGKKSGPVMSSDLDRYESLYIVGWLGDFYRVGLGDHMMEIPAEGITIRSLEDVKEFRNLTSLTVQIRDLSDLSPLASLEGLTYLNLLVSPKLSTLDWLQGMTGLEELMMWGESYPEIKDIRVFEGMENLTSVMIILPSVKDISVFADLPKLETLWINCNKNVDITPVKEAGQIKSLMVNTEEIR